MSLPDHQDATRDALALIEALHRQDLQGTRVLLDNTDLRLTAACLARIAADLVGDLAEWWHAAPGDLLARLREHHAEGGG